MEKKIEELLCNYVSKRNNVELNIFKIISGNLPEFCVVPKELGIENDWESHGEFYVFYDSCHWEDGARWRVPVQAFIMDYKLEKKSLKEYLPALDDLKITRVG